MKVLRWMLLKSGFCMASTIVILAAFCPPVKAQTAPTISVAAGPCTGNTSNGQVIPVWTGTQVACITEAQYSSQPPGSWNLCLSGLGQYQNGVWSCAPSSTSAAYSQIYLNCLAYGLGATIECSNSTWAEDLLFGFVPNASWLTAGVSLADMLVNRKTGYHTICDAASIAASAGKSLPYALVGAAVDAFCQAIPSTPPASYVLTATSPTGAVTNVTVDTTGSAAGPTITSITGLQAVKGVISAAAGSQLLQFAGGPFYPGLTVIEAPPSGLPVTLAAPQVQDVSSGGFILAVNFGGNPGFYGFQVENPDGTQSNVFSLTVGTPAPTGPSLVQALVKPQAMAIQSSPGTRCVQGMVTGGGKTSGPFANGQSASATDADGFVAAETAYGPSSSNSFSTSTVFFTIGGACVTGSFDQFTPYSATNTAPGASSASLNFTTNEPALVVVLAFASSQKTLTLSGIPGLTIDATSAATSGWEPMVIGHAELPAGSHSISEASSIADLQGQDPNHMVDMIAVYVFGYKN